MFLLQSDLLYLARVKCHGQIFLEFLLFLLFIEDRYVFFLFQLLEHPVLFLDVERVLNFAFENLHVLDLTFLG